MASICGLSGLGDGGMYSKCNFLKPGATGGQYPEFIQLKEGTEGYKTDWNNFAPSVSVAWRPNVQDGFLRTLLGDPDQATLRAGYSVAYERQGLTTFTTLYGGNAGLSTPLTRNASSGPGARGRVVAGPPVAEGPPVLRAVQPGSVVPDPGPRGPRRQPQRLRAGHQDRPGPELDDRLRAVDLEGHGGRDPLRRQQGRQPVVGAQLQLASAPRTSSRTGSSTSSSWRWPTSRPTTPPAAAASGRSPTSARARAPTRCRSTWPTSTAARTHEPGGLHGRVVNLDEHHARGPAGRAEPEPDEAAASDLDGTASRRTNAANAGYPANFFVLNPAVNAGQRHRQRRVQRLPRAADRTAAAAVERPLGERQLPVRVRKAARRSTASATAARSRRRPTSATRSRSRRTGRSRSAGASGSAPT